MPKECSHWSEVEEGEPLPCPMMNDDECVPTCGCLLPEPDDTTKPKE